MKVHEAIAQGLIDSGVTTLFGLIGDANLFMVDSYVRKFGGRYIAAAHEAGAALMGLGYAYGTGQLGVATVTHGPATTNTLTPLIEGVKGQIPMLLICGDTNIEERENLQDVSQRDLIVATGAGFEQARSPATIARDLSVAIRRALTEQRPVVFNVPINFQWQTTEYHPEPVRPLDIRGLVARGDELDNAIGIIASARKPVILAGRGAIHARQALARLAERIGAPLATTLKARELFKGEPFNLGIFGTLSSPVAADEIIAADCIIAFGAGLNRYTTSDGAFLKGKRIIQCDVSPATLGRHQAVDAAVIGDTEAVAEAMCELLDLAEIPPSAMRSEELLVALADHRPVAVDAGVTSAGTIGLRKALARIDAAVPADRVVVTDAGRFMLEAWQLISVPDPQSFHITINFGSIGLGVPWAVGASASAPSRPTVLVSGDGGFMHGGLNEFNTAVRHGADLIVVVCNDGGYGAEEIQFRARQMDASLAFLEWPDLAPLAVALGGEGITVRTEEELEAAALAIANRKRPLLIELKISPAWGAAIAY